MLVVRLGAHFDDIKTAFLQEPCKRHVIWYRKCAVRHDDAKTRHVASALFVALRTPHRVCRDVWPAFCQALQELYGVHFTVATSTMTVFLGISGSAFNRTSSNTRIGTANITASHLTVSENVKNVLPSGFLFSEYARTRISGAKRRMSVCASAPNAPYPTIPTVSIFIGRYYLFRLHFSNDTRSGVARKIDEYVPAMKPTIVSWMEKPRTVKMAVTKSVSIAANVKWPSTA